MCTTSAFVRYRRFYTYERARCTRACITPAAASGGNLADVVKLNIFLTDLSNFPIVNEIMAQYFEQPYPARAAIGVSALPKGVGVEMDAVLVIE